jgi:predicted porin
LGFVRILRLPENFSWTHAKFSDAPSGSIYIGSADQFGLQYLYNLSKRSTLYAGMGYLKNKGGADFFVNVEQLGATAADLASGTMKSSAANVGIRHVF